MKVTDITSENQIIKSQITNKKLLHKRVSTIIGLVFPGEQPPPARPHGAQSQ